MTFRSRNHRSLVAWTFLVGVLAGWHAPASNAQSALGNRFQGMGEDPPSPHLGDPAAAVPDAIRGQLPPGCTQTWRATAHLHPPQSVQAVVSSASPPAEPPPNRSADHASPPAERSTMPPPYLRERLGQLAPFSSRSSGSSVGPVSVGRVSGRPAETPAHRLPASRPYAAPPAYLRASAAPRVADNNLLADDNLLGPDAASDAVDPLTTLGAGPAAPQSQLPSLPAANPHAGASQAAGGLATSGEDPHAALLGQTRYPSALACAQCHPQHFEEWRTSAHAYAAISPLYQRFEQTMVELSQGTIGTFCARCHSPVATQVGYSRSASAIDAPSIVREGITCIACHRVNEAYGRTNGQRRIEPGDIHAPVYGGGHGQGLAEALAQRKELKLKTDASDQGPGQAIHRGARYFEPITRSDFCASCHQVSVHPGIWLEVVHAQYRSGPAAAKGIRCQDCHMGAVPGKPAGYEEIPIAELAGKPWGQPRRHANHTFWGPNYSIAHPGLFPLHKEANRWTPREWLQFDYTSDWGKPQFERNLPTDVTFPEPWDNTDDRRDARKIIEANFASLDRKRAASLDVMESAIAIEGPFFESAPDRNADLRFHFRVRNLSEGHNLPTGSLGAQPQVWLNVAVINPEGRRVWESGYLDSRGDLADVRSVDVATGRVPRDAQLFNLQTKSLINTLRGTDREVSLPLNFNLDQLVFLRPGAVPVSVLNHPPLLRMEAHSIPPLGHRDAHYSVPAGAIRQPGRYRLSVRMRSRPEPTYLMHEVGATPDMIRRMNEGILNIHPRSHTFRVP